jgi:hypothetical protein
MFLKSLRLIFLVFNFSFFIGMFWLIMCKTYEDFYHKSELKEPVFNGIIYYDKMGNPIHHTTFISHYDLETDKHTNF